MRAAAALALVLACGACGDDSDSIEDPPTMRRTTGGADIVPAASAKAPAGSALVSDAESCTRHLRCCESLLRVPGAGGQPRSCFQAPEWRTQGADGQRQCEMGTGRIVSSLRARGLEVPSECASN